MNESGRSAGPARGAYKLELDHVLVVHDEIDLPFGDIRTRLGGGLAGHNGLKSLKRDLGSPDFQRVRIGVGRPDSTDPEIVSAHVLGTWRQRTDEVRDLVPRGRRGRARRDRQRTLSPAARTSTSSESSREPSIDEKVSRKRPAGPGAKALEETGSARPSQSKSSRAALPVSLPAVVSFWAAKLQLESPPPRVL